MTRSGTLCRSRLPGEYDSLPYHIKHDKQKDKIDTCTINMQVCGKYHNNYKSNIKCSNKITYRYEYEVIIIKASSNIAMK